MTTPTLPDEYLAATVREKLQYHRLRPGIFRDQHGREWSCQLSTETLHPASPLTPVGWKAPYPMLVPPAKYLGMGRAFGTVEIDYDQWLRDIHEGRRAYDEQVMEWARRLYGGAALQAIKAGDPDLRRVAGPGPMSPEFVRAMKAGVSKWALGLPHPSGVPYPTPKWAEAELHTLQVYETWDGTDVDTAVDATKYADEEPVFGWDETAGEARDDEPATVAAAAERRDAELAEARARYGDAVVEPAPVTRSRGRPRAR